MLKYTKQQWYYSVMPKDVRASSPHFTYILNNHSRGQTTLLFLCSLFRIIELGIIHCFSDFQSSTHFGSHCVTFGIIVNVIYIFYCTSNCCTLGKAFVFTHYLLSFMCLSCLCFQITKLFGKQ